MNDGLLGRYDAHGNVQEPSRVYGYGPWLLSNVIVEGSTTAGVDGNVSRTNLPGNLSTLISGLEIYYPNRTPTQRVGVHIDVHSTPTINGHKDGRDEVLETARRLISNTVISPSELKNLAHSKLTP
jgi:hypothetical protein